MQLTFNWIGNHIFLQLFAPLDGLRIIDDVLDHHTSTALDCVELLCGQTVELCILHLRDVLHKHQVH
jgi:hypothetical protein